MTLLAHPKLIDALRSVKIMFDEFEDKNLGYTEDQVDEVAQKLLHLDQYNPKGQEEELNDLLMDEEKTKIALAYAFFAKRKNPFSFLNSTTC